MSNQGPLQINLREVIKSKFAKASSLPGFIFSTLERLICQEELNEILRNTYPAEGWKFAEGAAQELDIRIVTEGLDRIPTTGRFIFASNHPLGGLDGIALISILAKKYGDDNFRFLVNDILLNVTPLRNVFLPINKYGSQGKEAAKMINEVYASARQVAIFPAGLCSRKGKNGIRDLQWQKAFVAKAIRYERDIIPVHVLAENSRRFYQTAQWRKRLGIKVNLEQILLPSEVCKSRGKTIRIIFGQPISWRILSENGLTPLENAEKIKELVYAL